jgi:hypothetical protein
MSIKLYKKDPKQYIYKKEVDCIESTWCGASIQDVKIYIDFHFLRERPNYVIYYCFDIYRL